MASKIVDPKKAAIQLTSLWQRFGRNTYPIDLDELVNGAILTSNFSDNLKVDRRKFDGFEGALVQTKGTRNWTLLLNTEISNIRRQRFTFAHELGHFMCHRKFRCQFKDSEDSLNDFQDEFERQANVFASWLLMPANLLRDEFGTAHWKIETLQAIGIRFECSLQASALRYVELSSRPIAFVVSRDGTILWAVKSKSAPYLTSYCFGDELPEGSHALECKLNGEASAERKMVGPIWNDDRHAFESQYFDQSGRGFQYTCIEFQ